MVWVGQKDLFRAGLNRIFLFLVLFKNGRRLVSPGSHLFLFCDNQRNEETARAQDFSSVRPQGWKDCPQIFRELLKIIYLFPYLSFCLYIYLFIYFLVYLFIHSFIHSFICLFIYLFIFTFVHTNFKYR